MYTFSQLLIRNALLGIVFTASTTLLAFYFLAQHSAQQQDLHQQGIYSVANALHNNQKEMSSTLRKNADYDILVIRKFSNQESLYSYKNSKKAFSFAFLQPELKTVSMKNIDLAIEYQLSNANESILIAKLLSVVASVIALLIIFATIMSKRHSEKFFHAINQQIKIDLALIKAPEGSGAVEDLVDIPELKQGILEIKQLIESQVANSSVLEKEAYTDHLTHLDNRNKFVQFYENVMSKESKVRFGVLIITRCSELQTVNQIHGYHEGDNYIVNVSKILNKGVSAYRSGELFRLNSSDFATVLPNVTLKEAENYAADLTSRFNEFQQASDLDSVAYSGLVYFDRTKPLGELLALADTGISIAQTQHINAWYVQKDTESLKSNDVNRGNQNWRQEIESVVENQRVSLLIQPIQPTNRNSKVYSEVLARFLNSNDEMLPTASFIAMAEKLDKISAVDKLIIETTLNEIASKNIVDQSFGINISARTITDEQFLIWLERRLLREPNIAPRIIFEITEHGLQQNIKTSKRFIDMVHRSGARVCVERFGVGLTSFKFFRDLKPDFIKMDSTYTRDIDDDKNNQYFLRLMVDLAHRLSINVLAESVESQEEKHTLDRLFLDGCQGFYIGKPKPI
ncbi:EAL domain-containing protein [Thalassotalea atypica]|uniref:EAL domain-containing protein n=1 Tax=Thalassotalea atypica TaxID=2054316 RepID=UPI00257307B0|nr:GGDEF domain-containing protein [Thalassotalea atypica]